MLFGRGAGGVPTVPDRTMKSAPRVSPYQSNEPSRRFGPSHTARTTAASSSENAPQSVLVPTSAFGSYAQVLGSSSTPSLTPSLPSHAAPAASVAALYLHGAI